LLLYLIRKGTGAIPYSDSTANVAISFHANRLLVLGDNGMPYSIAISERGAVKTLGIVRFYKDYNERFSAHPKVHPDGRMFAVNYTYNLKHSPANVAVIDERGVLSRRIHIWDGITRRPLIHDAGLTEHFVIIIDMPLVLRARFVLNGGSFPYVFEKSASCRFGLLPINSQCESDIQWFELPAVCIFHTINSWEEGPRVILWACCRDSVNLSFDSGIGKGNHGLGDCYIGRFEFDTSSGLARQEKFLQKWEWSPEYFACQIDLPNIHPDYTTKNSRYAYLAVTAQTSQYSPWLGGFIGCIKFDMLSGVVCGKVRFDSELCDASVQGGETSFVPRARAGSEDDGYLLVILTNKKAKTSELVVYDAKSMNQEPICRVPAPIRIPYGFHSSFISERNLRAVPPF
jgi:carotenoid cleavage dioxygenase-like enzyme